MPSNRVRCLVALATSCFLLLMGAGSLTPSSAGPMATRCSSFTGRRPRALSHYFSATMRPTA